MLRCRCRHVQTRKQTGSSAGSTPGKCCWGWFRRLSHEQDEHSAGKETKQRAPSVSRTHGRRIDAPAAGRRVPFDLRGQPGAATVAASLVHIPVIVIFVVNLSMKAKQSVLMDFSCVAARGQTGSAIEEVTLVLPSPPGTETRIGSLHTKLSSVLLSLGETVEAGEENCETLLQVASIPRPPTLLLPRRQSASDWFPPALPACCPVTGTAGDDR